MVATDAQHASPRIVRLVRKIRGYPILTLCGVLGLTLTFIVASRD